MVSFEQDDAFAVLRRLDRFRDVAAQQLGGVPRSLIELWSLADADALISAAVTREVGDGTSLVVLDIGTFLGASALHFAALSPVRHVVSVDPNPAIGAEIEDKARDLGLRDWHVDSSARTLDAARSIITEFREEQSKIDLVEGYVGSSASALHGDGEEGAGTRVPVPQPEEHGAERLLAFVDGLHTAAAVRADLDAVFAAQPGAIALLDDCRHVWGLQVQSGIAAFIESASDYRFRLLADLVPGGATTSLGLVYGPDAAGVVEPALRRVSDSLSRLVDPIVLLRRNDELVARINSLRADSAHRTQAIVRLRDAIAGALSDQGLHVSAVRRSLRSLGRRILSAGD